MANSGVQLVIEQWIIDNALADRYGQAFARGKAKLAWGADAQFDAISDDGSVVAVISTSQLMMASGKQGSGKKHKVLMDLAFLYIAACERRVAVFTESCMRDWVESQQHGGKVSPGIELLLVELPAEHRTHLEEARRIASEEVRPA